MRMVSALQILDEFCKAFFQSTFQIQTRLLLVSCFKYSIDNYQSFK